MSRTIEWVDRPTMKPRNTRQLRVLIERRTLEYLWGQRHWVVPRLVSEVFGDGRKLIRLYPIMYRPYHFVVRIDSGWSLNNWDNGELLIDHLDDIEISIEEEFIDWPWARQYGLKWSDDDEAENSSRIDWDGGSSWSEINWPRIKRKA